MLQKQGGNIKKKKEIIISFIFVVVGAIVAAFSIEQFLAPNNIMDGGIVGIGMVLDVFVPLPLSVLTFLLNVPFLYIGFRQMGSLFLAKTAVGMVVFSVSLQIFYSWNMATSEPLLATVFGGIVLGIGVGLVIRYGGCLDGTETMAILISKKTSLSVGQIILIFNILIYLVVGLLFGSDRAMYSLLTYFITSKVIDLVEVGLDEAKAVMIITNESQQISDAIFERLGRTVTILEGEGLISGKKVILYCVVTRIEIPVIKKILQEDDESGFMTVSDVSEIVGNHIKKKASKETK